MTEDKTDEEAWKEWRANRDKKARFDFSKTLKNLTFVQIIGIVVLIILGNYLWNRPDVNKTILMAVAIGGLLLFLWNKVRYQEKEIVEERVIKQECLYLMKNKVGYSKEFQAGTAIYLTPYCRSRWSISESTGVAKPFRWEVGFEAIYPNGLKKDYFALFTPYEGVCIGIVKAPTGYDATDSPDIKVVE